MFLLGFLDVFDYICLNYFLKVYALITEYNFDHTGSLARYLTYNLQPSVRTRRSNGPAEDATFSGVLKCISNSSSTKSITKKIGAHAIHLLLAHGFQVIQLYLDPLPCC